MVMNFLIQPMIFLSGAFYPIEMIPKWLKFFGKINPLTYGIDAMRYFSLGINEFNIYLDLTILIAFSITLVAIGSYLFAKE